MRGPIRGLVVASIVACSTSAPAEGFLEVLTAVPAVAGSGAQATGAMRQAQLEAVANDIMATLGVPAKMQAAKRAAVVQKLAALRDGQHPGAMGSPAAYAPAAGVAGLAGGARPMPASGKLAQGMAVLGAVQGAVQGAAGESGDAGAAPPSLKTMALATYAKSNPNSADGKIAGFLAQNPEMLDELTALASASDTSPEAFAKALSKIARAQQAKAGKNSTAWQVAATMAENPELTRQVLAVAGKSGSLLDSIGGLFKASPAEEKKPAASSDEGGGFLGGLKGMFKGGGESQPASGGGTTIDNPPTGFGS